MTVLVKGGTVVNADRSFRADVLCENGLVAAVDESIDAPKSATVVDAGGQFVMPGLHDSEKKVLYRSSAFSVVFFGQRPKFSPIRLPAKATTIVSAVEITPTTAPLSTSSSVA